MKTFSSCADALEMESLMFNFHIFFCLPRHTLCSVINSWYRVMVRTAYWVSLIECVGWKSPNSSTINTGEKRWNGDAGGGKWHLSLDRTNKKLYSGNHGAGRRRGEGGGGNGAFTRYNSEKRRKVRGGGRLADDSERESDQCVSKAGAETLNAGVIVVPAINQRDNCCY